MKYPLSARQGFTFIEVLVVTVIIGILISVAVVSYTQTTAAGRDSRRKQDLATLQTALEFYKIEFGAYPSCPSVCTPEEGEAEWIPGLIPEFAATLPVDPQEDYSEDDISGAGTSQTYNYESSGTSSYELRARLEDGSIYRVVSPL